MKIADLPEEAHFLIGADFDEKYIKLMAFDSKGKVFNDKGLVISVSNGPSTIRRNLTHSIHQYIDQLGRDVRQMVGLAVSCPGIISAEGTAMTSFNISWGKIPLGAELRQAFGRPVILENNGHAAAWGEKLFGAGRGFNTFVYIFVDDSVGGGIVLRNKLFRGTTNSAALFGHTVVKSGGKKCICGGKGCLESYVSTQGIVDTIEKNIKIGDPKSLVGNTSSEKQLIEMVNSLAHNGNALANSLLQEAGQYLGIVMYNTCILIGPEAIIISGKVLDVSDLILKYMQEYLTIALSNIARYVGKKIDPIPVIKSELSQDSRLLGVANLFLETAGKEGLERT